MRAIVFLVFWTVLGALYAQSPVLSPSERAAAEKANARVLAAYKDNPDMYAFMRKSAYMEFICIRAMKRAKFSPNAVDMMVRRTVAQPQPGGACSLMAYTNALEWAKSIAHRERGWDESENQARMQILVNAQDDLKRINAEPGSRSGKGQK